jgi:hypothetical protein
MSAMNSALVGAPPGAGDQKQLLAESLPQTGAIAEHPIDLNAVVGGGAGGRARRAQRCGQRGAGARNGTAASSGRCKCNLAEPQSQHGSLALSCTLAFGWSCARRLRRRRASA